LGDKEHIWGKLPPPSVGMCLLNESVALITV